MPGIANNTIQELQDRINGFRQIYVNDWNLWLKTPQQFRPNQLGIILRRWQACRPNTMRRTRDENRHNAPYLEDLVSQAQQYIEESLNFNIREESSFSSETEKTFKELWRIFTNLSYRGTVRNGFAGIVGISKAVLLLSDGRIGPAFDSRVRDNLGIGEINNSSDWISALKIVNKDIINFEERNNISLQNVVKAYNNLQPGRIYDMALGPN